MESSPTTIDREVLRTMDRFERRDKRRLSALLLAAAVALPFMTTATATSCVLERTERTLGYRAAERQARGILDKHDSAMGVALYGGALVVAQKYLDRQ